MIGLHPDKPIVSWKYYKSKMHFLHLTCQASLLSLVIQSLSCVQLCNPTDCSTPGFTVLHHLLELAQTHVHWFHDANQPSHPLSHPSPPAFNFSHQQDLFQWVGSLHQVSKVLKFQHQSFQCIFKVDFHSDWLVGSPCCPRDCQESFPALQFKGINSSALSLFLLLSSSIHTWLLAKP